MQDFRVRCGGLQRRSPTNILGKLTKSGTPGWFLNKIGYLFLRDGARLRTSAKRLQIAFWRLNPLGLVVYAQHPKPFLRHSNPQNSANDGPQKVLSTDNPILFRNTPGIPRPVLRFHKLSDFVHTAPVFVHMQPSCGRSRTQLELADCDATAAALLTSRPTKIRRH